MQKNASILKIMMAVLLSLLVIWLIFMMKSQQPKPAVSAVTRDGVVTQIQSLSRLESVAYGVDTIITAQKQGTWQRLWQDEQKGIFVAHGRVLAGVDLSKITADMVQVSYDTQSNPAVAPHAHVVITLPPSEVFEVFLDEIQVYDWQTGLFGAVDNDPKLLTQAQTSAKAEVLNKACQGDIMALAGKNASEQMQGLFMLTGASVTIKGGAIGACQLSR
ncbi:DUF4230 domain-containing protein [Moraxella nasovis]|uniref:DUF4230 domain-containing protein n=1 Tax=Moraxella nasovis TaxID=2904121 RepID=UPI001F610B49|nr:DUF4230 domain-containing protein [Moraxella nasovis]UNU72874.1 DUF4230 domain-containing protein [Moraxella nasovis]